MKSFARWKLEARISESFRFAPVRELAQQRLRQFGEFMDALARQHRGEDVAGLAGLDPSTVEATLPSFT